MTQNNTLIIGSEGTIGLALVNEYQQDNLITLSRKDFEYDEDNLLKKSQDLQATHSFTTIICCIGTLHDDTVQPEKSIKQIGTNTLEHYFYVNSILPALIIKFFSPLLSKQNQAVLFASAPWLVVLATIILVVGMATEQVKPH